MLVVTVETRLRFLAGLTMASSISGVLAVHAVEYANFAREDRVIRRGVEEVRLAAWSNSSAVSFDTLDVRMIDMFR